MPAQYSDQRLNRHGYGGLILFHKGIWRLQLYGLNANTKTCKPPSGDVD